MKLDLKSFEDRVATGLLTKSVDGDLTLYNYSRKCTYEAAWDEYTLMARGLVVDSRNSTVVALPFSKFFNHDEHGVKVEIPEGPPDCVTVKLDGSLGIGFWWQGKFRWTTRGSLFSEQGKVAQRIWDERYAGKEPPEGITLLAEIISPDTKNVVRYDYEDLVLLGMRRNWDGYDYCYEHVQLAAILCDMRITAQLIGGFETIKIVAATLSDQHEGFVARWGDHRVKVKSAAYCEVARLLQGFNERTVADYWYARKDLPEALPEESRDWAEGLMGELDDDALMYQDGARMLHHAHAALPDRKAFVAALGPKHPLFSLVMDLYSGREPDYRLHVYKSKFGERPMPVGG